MCEHSLESAISKNAKAESAKNSSSKAKAIMNEIAVMKARGGYVGHAKMDRVKGLLLEHFSPKEDDNGRDDIDPGNTRVMVFCSFRACLTELVVRWISLLQAQWWSFQTLFTRRMPFLHLSPISIRSSLFFGFRGSSDSPSRKMGSQA